MHYYDYFSVVSSLIETVWNIQTTTPTDTTTATIMIIIIAIIIIMT